MNHAVFMGLALGAAAQVCAVTIEVGPQRSVKTPCEAASLVKDGDTVLIDAGTYTSQACSWTKSRLTLRGVSKYAHLRPPSVISNGKAIWVIAGADAVVENIEFSDASVPDQNGAGIRAEGRNLTIRDCYFHDNEDGILGGSGHLLIERTVFAANGYGDGQSHNLYIGNCDTLTFRFCYSHHAKVGHELKSRAKVNFILYSRLMNESDGTASYEIDLPNGGTSFIIGNLIQQGPHTDNSTIISYGAEGLSNSGKSIYVVNNTIVNDRSAGTFVRIASGGSARVVNNLFIGEGTLISGTADTATNLRGQASAVIHRAGFDYHLASGSPAIDKGSDPAAAQGISLAPAFQYVHPASGQQRGGNGVLDIGAYEFGTVRAPTVPGPPSPRAAVSSAAVVLTLTNGGDPTCGGIDILGRAARTGGAARIVLVRNAPISGGSR